MSEDIKVTQEYPKYIQVGKSYKIVENEQEEAEAKSLIEDVEVKEKDEEEIVLVEASKVYADLEVEQSTGEEDDKHKDNSKGTDKKKSNTGRSTGTR